MKFYKWILIAIAVVVIGLLVYSLVGGAPRPVKVEPIQEQTKRASDLMEDTDLFSVYEKLTTDMIEGTVDY
ncbi:hypothetical protein C815_01839 [Firmicutes bacterium M10-2]|nr:hypothetical protein C815_01839 [Firmicutes bacterium M10-2]